MHRKRSATVRQEYNGFSKARIELQSKLLAAEKQIEQGEPLTDHDEVMDRLQRKILAVKE